MKKRTMFPALRCAMGDWIYYVTYMSFGDVSDWIQLAADFHTNKSLSDWIQRQLIQNHANSIAEYLVGQPERMFNALFVAVYEGEPRWAPLVVSGSEHDERFMLTREQQEELERSVGVLSLSGGEILFPVDGQHRVAGIQMAVQREPSLAEEEVCAIFVGHKSTPEGLRRTRRLFTTLNKSAKRVSKADIIALDEDDGFAVICRRLVEEYSPFCDREEVVAFTGSARLPARSKDALVSIITLYDIARELHPVGSAIKKGDFSRQRPNDDELNRVYRFNVRYWDALFRLIPEYAMVRSGAVQPCELRTSQRNHLMFRTVGQLAFAAAVRLQCERGVELEDAVELLASNNLWLNESEWHSLLWDAVLEKMLPAARNRNLATTHLLLGARSTAVSRKRRQEYEEFLTSRSAESDQGDEEPS